MRTWNLLELETPGGSRSPVVLHSQHEGRAVLVGLEPGQELGDHQVKEHSFLLVLEGSVRFESSGETVEAPRGTLVLFGPDERRSVSSPAGARVLMFFAPWPGEGHYRGEERSARVSA